MIGHHTVAQNAQRLSLLSLFQNTLKRSVVFFFLEQSHARVGSVEHVINEPRGCRLFHVG